MVGGKRSLRITPIDVDYREDASTSVGLASLLGPEVVATANLKYGDLWWATEEASYGVELKSVSDFLSSLWSDRNGERLERQLDGLRGSVDKPLLGIHGIYLPVQGFIHLYDKLQPHRGVASASLIARTKYSISSIEAFLSSINLQGVVTIWRPTKEGLLLALVSLYEQSAKDQHKVFSHVTTRGHTRTGDKQHDKYLDNLMSIPSVGQDTAEALLQAFLTPLGVYTALDTDLLKVRGVGAKTVKAIREAVQ